MFQSNPAPSTEAVVSLPENPYVGKRIGLRVDGLPSPFPLVWTGTVWASEDSGAFFAPADEALVALNSVAFVDGVAVPCDPAVHDRTDGICSALYDTYAIVRWMGLVEGFEGLTPNTNVAVGEAAGSVVEFPIGVDINKVFGLGYSYSATAVMVRLDKPVRM